MIQETGKKSEKSSLTVDFIASSESSKNKPDSRHHMKPKWDVEGESWESSVAWEHL